LGIQEAGYGNEYGVSTQACDVIETVMKSRRSMIAVVACLHLLEVPLSYAWRLQGRVQLKLGRFDSKHAIPDVYSPCDAAERSLIGLYDLFGQTSGVYLRWAVHACPAQTEWCM